MLGKRRHEVRQQRTPTLLDIIAARPNVYRYLKPTPLFHYPGLRELVGTEVWVKHENHQPVGAFKVRGGLNLVAHLTDRERKSGFFTASTGNHGQSIAYAARAHGLHATITVPEGVNPDKVSAMLDLGAEVVFHGHDFDGAREWIMEVAVALKPRDRLVGKRVVLIMSGGNLSTDRLRKIHAKRENPV